MSDAVGASGDVRRSSCAQRRLLSFRHFCHRTRVATRQVSTSECADIEAKAMTLSEFLSERCVWCSGQVGGWVGGSVSARASPRAYVPTNGCAGAHACLRLVPRLLLVLERVSPAFEPVPHRIGETCDRVDSFIQAFLSLTHPCHFTLAFTHFVRAIGTACRSRTKTMVGPRSRRAGCGARARRSLRRTSPASSASSRTFFLGTTARCASTK